MSALSVAGLEPATMHPWMRRLSLIALGDPPGTLADAAEVIGRATGSQGVVLWESPAPAAGAGPAGELSVLATWLATNAGADQPDLEPDALTREAHRERTLALPVRVGSSQLSGLDVDGALPVDYADGSTGVVTLCGAGGLSGAAFDTATELLTILPEVFTVIRERRTLALVNASDEILREADLAAGTQGLSRERLFGYFGQVCARLSESLHGARISIYLRETELDATCRYAVGYPPEQPTDDEPPAAETLTAGVATPCRLCTESGAHRLSAPLTNGTHVWGALRCEPVAGPPAYFTHSERSLLRPIAAQLARYWENWLNRRAIFEENESWRHLAHGITGLNKTLAEALLRGGASRRSQVATAALRVANSVVREASGSAVYMASRGGEHDQVSLRTAATAGEQPELSPAARAHAEAAYLSRAQRTTYGASPTAADGSGIGWIVSTPIHVGHQRYGAVTAEGPGPVPPANSAQVYDILSDQLGLYNHLAHTMDALKVAEQELKANLAGQAETMEDLKHQLVSPLRAATDYTDAVLRNGRFDRNTQHNLEAARGLCRKASRVALSAGVFATLGKGRLPTPRAELLGSGDLCRMLIEAATDCETLTNPELRRRFFVDRTSIETLGRRVVQADSSFLQQCVGNLLDNADKYSYAETEIVVSGALVCAEPGERRSSDPGGRRRSDQQFAITVASIGVPLQRDDREHCLQRNWRGRAARDATGEGSGIGLWIVDNLMRSMKGRVEIQPSGDALAVSLILPMT